MAKSQDPPSTPKPSAGEIENVPDTSILTKAQITEAKARRWFVNDVAVDTEQLEHIRNLRQASAAFSQIVIQHTQNCEDRCTALTHVRLASFFAAQAVLHRGR